MSDPIPSDQPIERCRNCQGFITERNGMWWHVIGKALLVNCQSTLGRAEPLRISDRRPRT